MMNKKISDPALRLSLKRKVISNLDFDAILAMDSHIKATGLSFDEIVSMAREIQGMSQQEILAMAEEEIAWLDSVVKQQQKEL